MNMVKMIDFWTDSGQVRSVPGPARARQHRATSAGAASLVFRLKHGDKGLLRDGDAPDTLHLLLPRLLLLSEP